MVDNERSPGWSHTGYEQVQTNTAWLSDFDENVFVKTKPTTECDWRSDLW